MQVCFIQDLCDLHLPHRADQVIDCVLWNVGSLKRSQQILVSLWFFRLNILNHHFSDQQILNMITFKMCSEIKKFHGKKKKINPTFSFLPSCKCFLDSGTVRDQTDPD